MKKETHPTYQKVLFVDSASGYRFVCGTTLKTEARETFEGVEYPVSYLSISSSSHPLFTGSKQLVDSEGRVEKFKKRFDRKKEIVKDASSEQDESSESNKEIEQSLAQPKKPVEKKAKKSTKA